MRWVWEAFFQLSSARTMIGGMALTPAPISFEAIDRYAARYFVLDFDYFFQLIKIMDGEFLKFQSERAATKRRGKGNAKRSIRDH